MDTDIFIKIDSVMLSLFDETIVMGDIINGPIKPNSKVKVVKVNKEVGLRIDECDMLISKIENHKMKKLNYADVNDIVAITLKGTPIFKIAKGMFIVSGTGDKELDRYLDEKKKN